MIVSVKPEELFLNFRRTRCNMKKNMVGVFSVLLTITTVLSCLGGCKPPQGGPVTEEIDPTKTQLYVFTYDGGYGSEWLYKIKERFEAVHANDTNWEDGKTGVQIVPNPSKSAVTDNVIRTTRDEIYITEGAEYYQYINFGAIGAGCVICEVQQSSNITYRVYDYNRRGADGKLRPLHIEKAVDVIDFHAFRDRTGTLSKGSLAERSGC